MRAPLTRVSTRFGRLDVQTEITTRHTCQDAWQVITDYDNLARYMPNLTSRTVGRTGTGLLVQQHARSSLLPVVGFALTLEFVWETAERLRFRRVGGSLRRFDGSWHVTPVAGGTRIFYEVQVEHSFPLPGAMLGAAVRRDVDQIMPAIVQELGRRQRPVDLAYT